MDTLQARFPLGHQVKLTALDRDPYPFFQQLLAGEPVSWIAAASMWYVVRRQDVVDVLGDPATYTVESPDNLIGGAFGPCMLSTEGDAHQLQRQPFAAVLTPRMLREQWAAPIEGLVATIIDDFAAAGLVDLKRGFADRVALQAVTTVLGLPVDDFDQMRGWFDAFSRSLSNYAGDAIVSSQGRAAVARFTEYVLSRRRRIADEAPDSLLAHLSGHAAYGLDDRAIISNVLVTLFGGLETTSAMLTNTVWLLLTHPDQYELVRSDPATWLRPAIEESLRYESPVQTCTRHVVRQARLHGVEFVPGDTVQCMLGAANRDPGFFTDPDRFDIRRANADQHLAFGRGRHFCIGAALARLEGEVALTQLIERLPALRLHPTLAEPPTGHEFRSPLRLVVTWAPGAQP